MEGKRIVLYGAGAVGQSYYLHNRAEIVLWTDKNYQKYESDLPVKPLDSLGSAVYDLLLIAVLSEETAESIRRALIDLGIEKEKIIWKEPICIYQEPIRARYDVTDNNERV